MFLISMFGCRAVPAAGSPVFEAAKVLQSRRGAMRK
jgi:hypothetical protein